MTSTMTSSSRELPLTRTNTNHTTKENDFMSFHGNLNNEFKLGGFQTKSNVTILAPAFRISQSMWWSLPDQHHSKRLQPTVNVELK